MTKSEKILFVGPRSRGGMDEVLKAYASTMPGAHFVASYHGGSAARKIVDFIGGYASAAWLLLTHPSIKIVHIHSASGASFRRKMYFARLARRLGRKVVMHVHSGRFADYFNTDPEGIARSLNYCDEVICLSDQWYDFFSSHGIKNLDLVPNPVNYPAQVEREADPEKIHLLYLGVLDNIKAKGVVDLVKAMAQLKPEVRDRVVLHIAGAGSEEDKLQSMISSEGLDDNVVLEGWVSGDEKRKLLEMCHCFVLPSYFEGLPVSILECMAWEMPIIASRVGGIPSIVEDGDNGYLIEPGDITALTDAITDVVANPTVRSAMGKSSRSKAAAYSIDSVVEQLDKIYARLLEE
ncbi:MAG: glycosyltransferase family 4 protein [Duncaniella sp.]|nr:glycosyltransferase family 4 protein [Duncaniella sp.]